MLDDYGTVSFEYNEATSSTLVCLILIVFALAMASFLVLAAPVLWLSSVAVNRRPKPRELFSSLALMGRF